MKWAIALALTALVAGHLCAAAKKHTAKKASTAQSAAHPTAKTTKGARTPVHASGVVKASAHSSAHTKSRGRRYSRASAGPSVQSRPAPERYQQIQQALADRGYYKGPVDGTWNADSVDALKRFQADEKMEPDGKLNSLSLIGLGLGPKHEGALADAPVATPGTAPPRTAANQPVATPNTASSN